MTNKIKLSFGQIINMNVGFFGIQYSFGLQQSAVNPIYDFLGASPDEIPWLNLAGPLTGLIIQPIIGALSDKTWLPKWGGRRKPFFLVGAIMCSLALFAFPFSSSLWMVAGLLWILDAGNNTAMEPYRAFIADKLDDNQQPTGFQAQSFFTGFGQTLANVSLFIFPMIIVGATGKIPNWVFGSFILGAVCSIVTVLWSMKTTPEIPPTEEEIAKIRAEKINVLTPFIDIANAIKDMPKVMWQLALVYLFQWYALFCYWQNSAKSVALSNFNWTLNTEAQKKIADKMLLISNSLKKVMSDKRVDFDKIFNKDANWSTNYREWIQYIPEKIKLTESELLQTNFIYQNSWKYEEAVGWTGLVNGWYNIVTFLVAFGLVYFARKYSPKKVHFVCLSMAAAGFLFFPYIENKYLLFPAITGFGIGWASMMGVPYLMVVSQIPKERYGVYMGIINMMIVIPMFIQTVTFGPIMKHFLDNDPRKAILFAGILLLISAFCTLLIQSKKQLD
jgi:maltose/moltooligosaccharide transporter